MDKMGWLPRKRSFTMGNVFFRCLCMMQGFGFRWNLDPHQQWPPPLLLNLAMALYFFILSAAVLLGHRATGSRHDLQRSEISQRGFQAFPATTLPHCRRACDSRGCSTRQGRGAKPSDFGFWWFFWGSKVLNHFEGLQLDTHGQDISQILRLCGSSGLVINSSSLGGSLGEMATHVAAAAGHVEVLEATGPVDRGAVCHHLSIPKTYRLGWWA